MITRILVRMARWLGDDWDKPCPPLPKLRHGDKVNEDYFAAIMEAQK